MPKYREEKNFFQENLLLIFIVGTIGISLLVIFASSYADNSKEQAIKKANDEVVSLMKSSDEKFKRAQSLVSKKSSDSATQNKAKILLQESVDDAKRATQLQPDNARAWFLLSEVYDKLINVNPQAAPLAEEALIKAIKLSPATDALYEKLATVYIFMKKYPSAEDNLKKAISLNKNIANYHYKLGNVYKELGEKEKAKAAYLEARKLTTSDNKMGLAQIDVQLKSLDKPSTAAAKISSKPTQKLQPTPKITQQPTPTPKPTQTLIKLGI